MCTVRCRNNALAGPFGGCFAVQQSDVTPSTNSANTIDTAQSLSAINAQIQENQADLPAAVAANQNAGSTEAEQNLAAANGTFVPRMAFDKEADAGNYIALVGATVTTKSAAQQTLTLDNVGTNAAAATDLGSGHAGASATSAAEAGATTTPASTKKGKDKGKDGNAGGGE